MQLAFATKKLRHLCTDPEAAERSLGSTAADNLIDRLADIRAAESLTDLLDISSDIQDGELIVYIELTAKVQLILYANHPGATWLVGQPVDYEAVWRLRLHEIEVQGER
ncbi:hypothetical protein KUM42_15830 [Modestobacter sp. L9-4]|uniref:hypothetical protein n=1 Tax=Modestobacter sp. L9-4 TaxID=2851567 RepID=UPI001C7493EC|nr:hypothetical protein [Modestobacter sp. L9-4]QXG75290.1 hypothetical protein KUM42_15830 [Modestobacter sp. L9-4]